jgi:DNA-binding IclR family transcriptional regulator
VRQRITKMTGHQARVLDQPDTHQREKSQASGTQTLLRGLALLECVAEGIGDVKGIAARLGTPRSTTHRMLNSLVAERYLLHVPYKGYLLGPKLIHLGMRALEQRPLVAMARPHIEALARRTGDTVHLGVLEGSEVFYLDKISGTRGLEMRSRVGLRMPIACTGLGKGLRVCLTRSSSHTVVSRSIILSKTFVRILDPVCRAGSHTRLKIM